jgi:hypothetical protein
MKKQTKTIDRRSYLSHGKDGFFAGYVHRPVKYKAKIRNGRFCGSEPDVVGALTDVHISCDLDRSGRLIVRLNEDGRRKAWVRIGFTRGKGRRMYLWNNRLGHPLSTSWEGVAAYHIIAIIDKLPDKRREQAKKAIIRGLEYIIRKGGDEPKGDGSITSLVEQFYARTPSSRRRFIERKREQTDWFVGVVIDDDYLPF